MMDETTMKESVEIPVLGMSCDNCIERITRTLTGVQGIEALQVELGRVRVEFYPQAVGLDVLLTRIRALGYTIPESARSRNPFRRFLNKMIETNEKTFGNQRLDCCTMKKN